MTENAVVLIILISLIILLLIFVISMIPIYLKKHRSNSSKNAQNDKNNIFDRGLEDIEKSKNILESKIQELNNKLESISGLTKEEAKKIFIKNLESELSLYVNKEIKSANEEIKNKSNVFAQEILTETMESLSENFIIQKSTSTIVLNDDQMKGRIIGKDGRNKRTFEMLTGVEILIDKTPEVVISSSNPIRRELAKNVMEKLIKIKNIEPIRIEKVYEEEKAIFENNLYQYAEKVIEDDLKIFDLDKKLYPIIGRLYFRYSYGQNILNHMKESALIASMIADKLNLDVEKAKRAAFLHDIGKSFDYEVNHDHIDIGLRIANEYKFDDYIVNSIASHHNNVAPNNIYSIITKIADTLSAARPGARTDSHEEYIERIETIEKTCLNHEGVKKAFAIRSGRFVRVIVEPSIINDNKLEKLGYEIKKKLENDPITNKFQIDVSIYRINNFSFKTKSEIEINNQNND